MEKEKTTETQQPKKRGFWGKAWRVALGIVGVTAVAYGAVKLNEKTGIITRGETAVKNGAKKVGDKIAARRATPAPVETPQYTEVRPQNNNGYQKNWQPRENGRPDNRPVNN